MPLLFYFVCFLFFAVISNNLWFYYDLFFSFSTSRKLDSKLWRTLMWRNLTTATNRCSISVQKIVGHCYSLLTPMPIDTALRRTVVFTTCVTVSFIYACKNSKWISWNRHHFWLAFFNGFCSLSEYDKCSLTNQTQSVVLFMSSKLLTLLTGATWSMVWDPSDSSFLDRIRWLDI